VKPLVLPPNQLHRFYRGGEAIAALRGVPSEDPYAPEDWVGAVNTTFGTEEEGLARLEDGRFVRDALAAEPEAFLGAEHLARFGPDPGLLVKLLDAGERLPVHFHPGRAFARETLGLGHGKTEAWLMIEGTRPGAAVHVGFREETDLAEVKRWIAAQDREAMLAALQPLEVAPGDGLLIPAGTPHAIGAGVFMVEVQEPTDLSVLMEWKGFAVDGEAEGHLGLGFDRALEALDTSAWDPGRLAALRGPGGDGARASLLPASADAYFRAERARGGARLEAGFAVLVTLDGAGTLRTEAGGEHPLRRGDTVLVPHAAGAGELAGDIELLRCRPAAPDAEAAAW